MAECWQGGCNKIGNFKKYLLHNKQIYTMVFRCYEKYLLHNKQIYTMVFRW